MLKTIDYKKPENFVLLMMILKMIALINPKNINVGNNKRTIIGCVLTKKWTPKIAPTTYPIKNEIILIVIWNNNNEVQ